MAAAEHSYLIERIPGISLVFAGKLKVFGIYSAEDLVALAQVHECHSGFRQLLGVSEKEFDSILSEALTLLPKAEADMAPTPIGIGRLGCALEADSLQTGATAHSGAGFCRTFMRHHRGVPREITLVDKFSEIRDQGRRGTCVAFAMIALREYCANLPHLSEQYLYWNCKQNDGVTGAGTFIHTAAKCLKDNGVCENSIWPYNPNRGSSEGQGPPPRGAAGNAAKYRSPGFSECKSDVASVKACLAYGRRGSGMPIVFGVPVYPSWSNAVTSRTGKIFMPLPGEKPLGGHALCLVGYKDDPQAPGGGWFLFRNSWGTSWASDSSVGSGYGMMPYAYFASYARGLTVMSGVEEKLDLKKYPAKRGKCLSAYAPAIVGLCLSLLIFNLYAGQLKVRKEPGVDHRSECIALDFIGGESGDAGKESCESSGDEVLRRMRLIWVKLIDSLRLLSS